MPTYQYICKKCNHEVEELQSMKEDPLVRCPNCGTDNLTRVLGSGSGLIFKGSGFYLTDYKKEGKKETKKEESGTKKTEQKAGTKSDSSPAKPSSDSSKSSASSSDKE
ncbi:MAG: zinc ribbon domain-containing protein [Ignavibacteria bacterium]|nr:zinc ribbon domain-containing protein [Ignavibacteria bacterium]